MKNVVSCNHLRKSCLFWVKDAIIDATALLLQGLVAKFNRVRELTFDFDLITSCLATWRKKQSIAVLCHESWIFPAGVSFALKQNMYWDGFCAFLPDISGLWGGGGPNPARISKFGGGGGVVVSIPPWSRKLVLLLITSSSSSSASSSASSSSSLLLIGLNEPLPSHTRPNSNPFFYDLICQRAAVITTAGLCRNVKWGLSLPLRNGVRPCELTQTTLLSRHHPDAHLVQIFISFPVLN